MTEHIVDCRDGAYVACPLIKNKIRPLRQCSTCEHCRGLIDRFPGAASMPFGARYMVACAHPVGRVIVELEENSDG